ncbi:MarR family transcriptional regulator [Paucilactobacillus suebicus]|uniref:MarR family winged helix-turn-helix transcriptional regulator n=1 Tax=Paucilactobacillus suebicus TaxID=152335 RepID=UPI000314B309|nr:MarR family transcriptional regulator [Paucilactobacillus suebicus]
MTDNKERTSLIKWISVADRYIKIQLDRELKQYQLSSSTYYYLLRLQERPGITQEGLIDLMYLNRSNVTRSINQLVDLGIVRKEIVQSDRRVSKLYLTDRGEELCPIIAQIRADAIDRVAEDAGEHLDEFATAIKSVAMGTVDREQKFDERELNNKNDK